MRNQFDRQLMYLNQDMVDMGALCGEIITAAAQVVATRDKELIEDMRTMEEDINQKERDVERRCMKLLLRQQPVARDLRTVTAAMKMVSDMERIGDQAMDIAEIIKEDKAVLAIKGATHLDKMSKVTITMVTDSIESFLKKDLDIAQDVIERDNQVNALFDQVKDEIVNLIHNDPDQGAECVGIIMIAKYFERIGDHACNIAEWVEFSITGEYKGGTL